MKIGHSKCDKHTITFYYSGKVFDRIILDRMKEAIDVVCKDVKTCCSHIYTQKLR